MDPETLALIRAWLAGEIPDPFGVSEQDANVWSGNFLPPADSDEYGTMDWQNDRLTMGKKANDVMSDPAYIAQLGTGPGGPGPEAFEPIVTYEPVKAPGYQNAMFMLNSGDPISSYIAGEMMGDPANGQLGKTAIQIVNELKRAAKNDPELAAALPTYVNTMNMREEPDWKSVQSIADSLQKDIIADPQFNAIDEKTGLPANRVETLSEIGQYFKDTNTPSPYETYSPDMLTTEGHLNAEQWHDRKKDDASRRVGDSQKKKADMEAILRELTQGRTMDEPVGRVSPNMDLAPNTGTGLAPGKLPSSALGVASTGYNNTPDPSFGTSEGRLRGLAAEDARRVAGQRRQAARSSQGGKATDMANRAKVNVDRANMAALMDRESLRAAQQWTKRNESKQRERQAMIQQLTAAGYTPYNNTQRARQAGVFGI